MKNKFRFLSVLILAACAVSLTTIQTQAQPRYDSGYTIAALSNTVSILPLAGASASNTTIVVDCRLQNKITLQVEAMNDASGAVNLSFPIQYSGDGVTYGPVQAWPITLSFNGVTKTAALTNLDTFGCGFIKIPYVTNAHATISCTNLVIRPLLKRNAP